MLNGVERRAQDSRHDDRIDRVRFETIVRIDPQHSEHFEHFEYSTWHAGSEYLIVVCSIHPVMVGFNTIYLVVLPTEHAAMILMQIDEASIQLIGHVCRYI